MAIKCQNIDIFNLSGAASLISPQMHTCAGATSAFYPKECLFTQNTTG